MGEMINYLYYKLYKAAKQSSLNDTAEFTATIFLGGLIGANIFVVSGFLAKLNILPFILSNKDEAALLGVVCITLTSILFLSKKRYKLIIKRYSQENEKERIRGNILVAVYVTLSFLLIFLVSFFKPN